MDLSTMRCAIKTPSRLRTSLGNDTINPAQSDLCYIQVVIITRIVQKEVNLDLLVETTEVVFCLLIVCK